MDVFVSWLCLSFFFFFVSVAPAACKLEKIGDLTFFQQQDAIVSTMHLRVCKSRRVWYYYKRCLLQAKKKTKKFQKGRVAQQKAKGERKPVASEKVIKEVLT